MKIVGVNISHDVSVCLLDNGKLKKFYHEDRLQKVKHLPATVDFNNFLSLNNFVNQNIDLIAYSGVTHPAADPELKSIKNKIHNKFNCNSFYDDSKHHLYHALNGFYLSNFDEAMCIVVDGGGAKPTKWPYQEIESIFYVNKNCYVTYFQNCSNLPSIPIKNCFIYSDLESKQIINGVEYQFTSRAMGGISFEIASNLIGFNSSDAGKLMGLSSYAHSKNKYNLNYKHVKLADEIQKENFERTCELINKAHKYRKLKNIILSGGVALNCVNNYKYVQKFKNLNFFVDPNPNDSGTSLGVALYCNGYN